MKQTKMRVSGLRVVSVLVLNVFFLSILTIPVFMTTAMAAAGAGAAGASGGTGTAAGIGTGTIVAGGAIAAAAALVIVTSGGTGDAVAPAKTPAQTGADLAKTNPTAASTVSNAMGTLDSTALSALGTTNVALGADGQMKLAQAAGSLTPAQFANFNTVANAMGLVAGSAQYIALQNLYASYTPAQLQALQSIYGAALVNGQFNQATMNAISAVIAQAGSGTPEQQAQHLRDAIEAILTARHPGSTVIVTVSHLGNNVWTTSYHVR